MWNPESWVLESGVQLKESGLPLAIGIENPSSTDKDQASDQASDLIKDQASD